MKKHSRPSFKTLSRHPKKLSVARESLLEPVTLDFDKIPPEFQDTLLSQTVCLNQLPIAVRVTESFLAKGSPITLKRGTLLLLCFVVRVPVVRAAIDKYTEYRLPLHSTQVFEKLPLGKLHHNLQDASNNGERLLCNFWNQVLGDKKKGFRL